MDKRNESDSEERNEDGRSKIGEGRNGQIVKNDNEKNEKKIYEENVDY